MDADYDIFEIANVIRDFWLIDAESYQRQYRTRHGKPLALGYYVVNWPEQIRVRRFNEHAEFHGPFNSREEAKAALEYMHKAWKQLVNGPFDISPITTPYSKKPRVIKTNPDVYGQQKTQKSGVQIAA